MFNVFIIPPKSSLEWFHRLSSSHEITRVNRWFQLYRVGFSAFSLAKWRWLRFFLVNHFCCKRMFPHRKCRLCMSFEACESSNLMHSVPFPRLGISGALFVVISYFIDYKLFRWIWCWLSVTVTVVTVVFWGVPLFLIFYL